MVKNHIMITIDWNIKQFRFSFLEQLGRFLEEILKAKYQGYSIGVLSERREGSDKLKVEVWGENGLHDRELEKQIEGEVREIRRLVTHFMQNVKIIVSAEGVKPSDYISQRR